MGHATKLDEFSERFKTAVGPPLEIMCMHLILSGHHTSLHICNHICHKKLHYNFSKNEGGGSKAVWIFSKKFPLPYWWWWCFIPEVMCQVCGEDVVPGWWKLEDYFVKPSILLLWSGSHIMQNKTTEVGLLVDNVEGKKFISHLMRSRHLV